MAARMLAKLSVDADPFWPLSSAAAVSSSSACMSGSFFGVAFLGSATFLGSVTLPFLGGLGSVSSGPFALRRGHAGHVERTALGVHAVRDHGHEVFY